MGGEKYIKCIACGVSYFEKEKIYEISETLNLFATLDHLIIKCQSNGGDFWGLKGMTEYVNCVDCIKLVTNFITCLNVPISKIPERSICQEVLHLDPMLTFFMIL